MIALFQRAQSKWRKMSVSAALIFNRASVPHAFLCNGQNFVKPWLAEYCRLGMGIRPSVVDRTAASIVCHAHINKMRWDAYWCVPFYHFLGGLTHNNNQMNKETQCNRSKSRHDIFPSHWLNGDINFNTSEVILKILVDEIRHIIILRVRGDIHTTINKRSAVIDSNP